jgi:hypothetical protein
MATPPTLTGDREQQVNQLANYVLQQTGSESVAEQWTAFAARFPNDTAAQTYTAWVLSLVGSKLPDVVGGGLAEGGDSTAQLAVGGAQGAAKFSASLSPAFSVVAKGFSDYFLRGLKILLGGLLILLGVARLTGADTAVTSALKSKVPI